MEYMNVGKNRHPFKTIYLELVSLGKVRKQLKKHIPKGKSIAFLASRV